MSIFAKLKPDFISNRTFVLLVAALSLATSSLLYCLFAFQADGGNRREASAGKSSNLVTTSLVAGPVSRQGARPGDQMISSPGASISADPAKASSVKQVREGIEGASRTYQNAVAEVNQIATKFNVTLNSSDMTMPPPKTFTSLDHDAQFMKAYGDALAAKRIYEAAYIKFKSELSTDSTER